ncbi:hypothetical protein CTI12_AA448020 [Artemisia annua]|uniref:Uncharacterized protein n=1 Tax=Artemisia annua TaxID=35608 RepID=A0A2U1LWB7_ARTAN|nr:hypothetical protein CTI12_AA448020 [Artemisia annua]
MMQSRNGAKRPRDDTRNRPLDFIPGLRLSRHPSEQRKDLFLMKFDDVAKAKSLHPTEFEGYTIRERFAKMGWEQLLNFKCDKIYRRVVIQWTASLSRNGDELTGIVDGKSYTITPKNIRDILKVDTRTDLPYAWFNKLDFQTTTDENKLRWVNACTTVFGTHEDAKATNGWYLRSKMTPLAKVLWLIGASTFYPRAENMIYVGAHEIYLLHALFTGEYLYSFAHLMIDDIWSMYENEHRQIIPHGYYISEILNRLGAVIKDEYVEVVPPQYRVISRESIPELKFSESPTEYIIDDLQKVQRVTFLKNIKPGVASRKSPQPPFENKPPEMRVPDPRVDMTKLQNLIISHFQKQHSELKTRVTNIEKQIERQGQEIEKQAEEREKSIVNNIQKLIECQAFEAVRREQETERRAEHREQEVERRAERREQEIERRAELRAHAIIWDIERQHYFHEQEQAQLRISWNQGNSVNGVDEFQFPQISRTSFHPPRVGSRYYDPTQSDEIPKEFEPLFSDIYGP